MKNILKKYVKLSIWPIPLLSLVIETFINPLKQGRHCMPGSADALLNKAVYPVPL